MLLLFLLLFSQSGHVVSFENFCLIIRINSGLQLHDHYRMKKYDPKAKIICIIQPQSKINKLISNLPLVSS